ncbi:MAG: signal peptidase I [Solirubrobacterales bacterium]
MSSTRPQPAEQTVREIEEATRQGGRLLKVVVLAVVVFCIAALAVLRVWPPLNVVMSASMEPTIDTGDVIVMKKLGREPRKGDIVAITVPEEARRKLSYPPRVVHRVVEVKGDKLVTKGDARDEPDPFTVSAESVQATVAFTIPAAGKAVAFITSPLGLVWIAAGVLLLVVMPHFEAQREQSAMQQAELGSIGELRDRLDAVLDGDGVVAARAPPGPVPDTVPDNVMDLPMPFETPELERLTRETGEMRHGLEAVTAAVADYGHHLRSHTEILVSMSAASQELAKVAAQLQTALASGAVVPASAPGTVPPALEPPTVAEAPSTSAEAPVETTPAVSPMHANERKAAGRVKKAATRRATAATPAAHSPPAKDSKTTDVTAKPPPPASSTPTADKPIKATRPKPKPPRRRRSPIASARPRATAEAPSSPVPAPAPAAAETPVTVGASDRAVEVNAAGFATLRDVGFTVLEAAAIIDRREELSGYGSADELRDVLPESRHDLLAKLRVGYPTVESIPRGT